MSFHAEREDLELVEGAVPTGLAVAFGEHPAGGGEALVRFAVRGRGDEDEPVAAPAGERLWRRSPWPAADDLFTLGLPADGSAVLVVHPDEQRRSAHAAKLAAHGLTPAHAPRLRRADLEAAATVIFLDDGGFPPLAPAACAATRLVILQIPAPLFGLQDGVDCIVADDDRSVVLAQIAGRAPRAFDAVRAMARLSARAHRASDVYERLAHDLALGIGRGRDGQRRSA
jgi:hypothetical protein